MQLGTDPTGPGPLSWPSVPSLRTCARLSPATQTPWTQAAVAACLFLSWTGQSVAWGRSAGSQRGMCMRVCVCVHTRAYSHMLTQTCTLRPSSWDGRQQDLSKRGQRALALSWVCWSGEVGSPVLAPPPLPMALFQAYGTLATLLEQAGVQGSPLDHLTAPRERSVLGDACSRARCSGLWTGVCCQRPHRGAGLLVIARPRASMCPALVTCPEAPLRVPSALCGQNLPAVPALWAGVGCPV